MMKRAVHIILMIITAALLNTNYSIAQGDDQLMIVPAYQSDTSLPLVAHEGAHITLKGILRNTTSASGYTITWDANLDGDFTNDYSFDKTEDGTVNGVRDIGRTFEAPSVNQDTIIRVRVKVLNKSTNAEYFASMPIFVHDWTPSGNPANWTDEQREVMRELGVQEAMWYVHRSLTDFLGNNTNWMRGYFVGQGNYEFPAFELFASNFRYPAYPPGTINDYGNGLPAGWEPANDNRWNTDPYAETTLRLMNYLLQYPTSMHVLPDSDEESTCGIDVNGNPIVCSRIPNTDNNSGIRIDHSIIDAGKTKATARFASSLSKVLANHFGVPLQTGDNFYGVKMEFAIQELVDFVTYAQFENGICKGSYYYSNYSIIQNSLGLSMGEIVESVANDLSEVEEYAGPFGVIVNNRVKYFFADNIITQQRPDGLAGKIANLSPGNFNYTGGYIGLCRWLGIHDFSLTDNTIAFPGYSTKTKGELKQAYNTYWTSAIPYWTSSTKLAPYGWLDHMWGSGDYLSGNTTDLYDASNNGSSFIMHMWAQGLTTIEPSPDTIGNHQWKHEFITHFVRGQSRTMTMNDPLSDYANFGLFGDNLCDPAPSHSCVYGYGGRIWSTNLMGNALTTMKDTSAPIALAQSDQNTIWANASASFSHAQSFHPDPSQNIIQYDWDADNSDGLWWDTGAQADFTTNNRNTPFTYTYISSGTKTLTLRIRDSYNPTAYYIRTLIITVEGELIVPAGSGTSESPYIINCLENLRWISHADSDWDGYYELGDNIDASTSSTWYSGTGFMPIGTSTNPFTGNFDGKGYIISNLTLDKPSEDYAGLFGYIDGAVIENVKLSGIDITANNDVGGIAGSIIGATTISACYVEGDLNGANAVGGIIGRDNGTGNRTNCHYDGNITATAEKSEAGGFTGIIQNACTISNCSTKGTVTGSGRNCGGFVGWMDDGIITKSFADVDVTNSTSDQGRIGGFIGALAYLDETDGEIHNCYSFGNVSVPSSTNTTKYGIGGFVGSYYGGNNDRDNIINNSYSTGQVSAPNASSYVGGFSGEDKDAYSGTGNFWNTETSGWNTSSMQGSGETGRTTAQMQTRSTFTDAGWDFIGDANGADDHWSIDHINNNGYPFFADDYGCWTGAARSSDWFATSNWHSGAVPTSNDTVSIAYTSNNPSIGGGNTAECYSLAIASGSSVTIGNDGKLTVSDKLNIKGSFTIESDADGTGSLITGGSISGTGSYDAQRFIANDNGWHLLSAPASDITIVGSDFVPDPGGGQMATNFDLFGFDQSENGGSWINIRAEDGTLYNEFETSFSPGKGYLNAYAGTYGNTNFSFDEPFNTGTISAPALAYTNGSAFAGYNLIGNPYPSGIDWNLATRTAFEDDFVYIYNQNKEGGAGYEAIDGSNANAYIAPHQGFFVKVSQAGSFYFTNDIRVHEGSFLKEEKTEDLLVLHFVKGKAYDQLIFRKRENSSFARDRLDALKLFSYDSQMPQLYSYSEDGRNLCVNTVPGLYTPHGLDIALYVPAQGTYSIKLAEATGVFADQPAWLEDLKEGTWHELSKDGEHSFSAATSDDPLRFKLHFSAQDIDEEQIIRRTFHLWTVQDVLYINNPSLHKGSIEVFGLAGQRLGSYKLSGNEQQSISMPAVFGVYLVQINWDEGSESYKVLGR